MSTLNTTPSPEMIALDAFRTCDPTAKEIRWAILLCGGDSRPPEDRLRFFEVQGVPALQVFVSACELTLTPELVNMFIEANPPAWEICLLMRDCGEFARTGAMLGHFVAANPTAWEICLLMRDCGEFARTPEMLSHFLAAKPTPAEARWMINQWGDFALTPEIIAIASADR